MVGERRRDRARAVARERRRGGATSPRSASPACCPPSCCSIAPGACCGRASSRAMGAAARKSTSCAPRSTRRPFSPRPATASTSSSSPRSCAGSSATSPTSSRASRTVFGSYDYINWRLTGERAIEQNWALEAGLRRPRDARDRRRRWSRSPMSRAQRCRRKIASHAILGAVTARGAAETGLARGHAGHRRRGGPYRLGAWRGRRQRRATCCSNSAASVDILIATDQRAPTRGSSSTTTSCPASSCRTAAWRPAARRSTGSSRQFAGGEAQAAQAGRPLDPSWLDRLAEARPAGSDGLVILPYFLGEKTPIHDPTRARPSTASRSRTTSAISGARCSRRTPTRSRHHVEVLQRDRLPDGALHRLRRRLAEPGLDADRRRRPAAPASAAGRPSRLLPRRRLDGRDRRRPRVRLVGDLRLRAPAPTGSSRGREAAEVYRRGYRRYRDLYRRLAERSELAAP